MDKKSPKSNKYNSINSIASTGSSSKKIWIPFLRHDIIKKYKNKNALDKVLERVNISFLGYTFFKLYKYQNFK